MAVILSLMMVLGASAREGLLPGVRVQGVADLSLSLNASEVRVDLVAPTATWIGFGHAPRTDQERQTLRLARENLAAGDAMIRFNTRAACRLLEAKVTPGFSDAAGSSAKAPPVIRVGYRFQCDQPQALDSAALGLFIGFPALERVLVRYRMEVGRGVAELTPGNPVVSFVPF